MYLHRQSRTMLATNALLMIAGAACLLFSFWALRKLAAREGRPPSAWTRTELGASAVAIGLLTLMLAGVAFVLQGALA
jgi:hypothetical protein